MRTRTEIIQWLSRIETALLHAKGYGEPDGFFADQLSSAKYHAMLTTEGLRMKLQTYGH